MGVACDQRGAPSASPLLYMYMQHVCVYHGMISEWPIISLFVVYCLWPEIVLLLPLLSSTTFIILSIEIWLVCRLRPLPQISAF